MRKEPSKKYWFPAKRYGWGWGIPNTWQGWVVLGIYLIIIMLLSYRFPPVSHPVRFAAGLAITTSLLVLICWRTGEPPRWRWGGTDLE